MQADLRVYMILLCLMNVISFEKGRFNCPNRLISLLKSTSKPYSPFVFNLENQFPLSEFLSIHADPNAPSSPPRPRISGVFAVADPDDAVIYVESAVDVCKALTHLTTSTAWGEDATDFSVRIQDIDAPNADVLTLTLTRCPMPDALTLTLTLTLPLTLTLANNGE